MKVYDRVLVTGGTGFLARHTIHKLLDLGFAVRASVRSHDKGRALIESFAAAGAPTGKLSVAIADLTGDAGWAEALDGIDAVLHLATPMQGRDVLAAATEGTGRVLTASAKAGVKRVILTSSGLAALRPAGAIGHRVTESDWTDTEKPGLDVYTRAKTLAERSAWDLSEKSGLTLTTILPGAIIGPAAGGDQPIWLSLVERMLKGQMAAVPPIAMQWVDVRDVADLHIGALTSPAAEGQRYLAAGEKLSLREIAMVLREELGADAQKVSTREMPDWLLRVAGVFNAEARQAARLMAPSPLLDADKARKELGWAPRAARASVIDMARSLTAASLQ